MNNSNWTIPSSDEFRWQSTWKTLPISKDKKDKCMKLLQEAFKRAKDFHSKFKKKKVLSCFEVNEAVIQISEKVDADEKDFIIYEMTKNQEYMFVGENENGIYFIAKKKVVRTKTGFDFGGSSNNNNWKGNW